MSKRELEDPGILESEDSDNLPDVKLTPYLEPLVTKSLFTGIPEAEYFRDGEPYLIVFQMLRWHVRGAYKAIFSHSETDKALTPYMYHLHPGQYILRFKDPVLVYGEFPKLRGRKGVPAYIEIGNVDLSDKFHPRSVDNYVNIFLPKLKFDFIKVISIKDARAEYEPAVSDWAVRRLPSSLNDPKDHIRGYLGLGGSKRRKRKTKRRRTRRR